VTEALTNRAVARLLGATPVEVTVEGRAVVAYDAFQAGRRVSRVHGTAVVGDVRRQWSLVEKVTDPPGTASAYLRSLADRELAAYLEGGLTDGVRALRAAHLYAHDIADDGTTTMLLEDVGPVDQWSPATYLLAARHLGRFAGRWSGQVPDHRWFLPEWTRHHGQLPALPEGRRLVRQHLADPPPELRGVTYGDARLLLDGQDRLRRALGRLPQTVCHHDAVRSNLFARSGLDGPETVGIDWELVGPGAVGADLASLLFASVRRGDLAVDVFDEILEPAVDSYVLGVRDQGGKVPRAVVRTGLRLATCLRWTLLRDVLVAAAQGDHAFHRGAARHEGPAEARRQLMALTSHLVREAREADG
jgi:hypothetical protein